jgi:DNA-binding NarL/FixJ family response regulator
MSKSTMNCVLLANRHHGLSEGMRGLLATMFDGVFSVADARSLLEGAARIQPDLVVVDLSLAGGDIVGFLKALKQQAPAVRVLLLTVHDEPTVARAALVAGADGVLLKRAVATELLDAVQTLCSGGRYGPSLLTQ